MWGWLSNYLILSFFALAKCEIEVEEGVLVLTDENFEESLNSNPLLLLEFYAPWCGHCKKLAPEYEAAAKVFADSNSLVKLAKVDATVNKNSAKRFGVKGYPTLKFYKNKQFQDYTGGRTAEMIIAWLTKKTGPPAVILETAEAASTLIENNQVVVLGFFKNTESDTAKAFLKVAEGNDDQVFGITSEEALFSKFETENNSVVLLKKFDEGINVIQGELTAEEIEVFVNRNAFPLVVEYSKETAKNIFGAKRKGHVMMFSSTQDQDHQARMETVRKVANDHKGEILFVNVDLAVDDFNNILEFFGLWSKITTFRIFNVEDEMIKYKPDSDDFTKANLGSFVANYLAGHLTPDLKSQEIPVDWDAQPVKVLVGKNFADVALDSSKDVLVEFYAPWCRHCKALAPIWDELGEMFKDDENLVIAKIDSTENEVKGMKVTGYPTIKLFKKGGNDELTYTGERTLEALALLLRPEQKTPDEYHDAKDEL